MTLALLAAVMALAGCGGGNPARQPAGDADDDSRLSGWFGYSPVSSGPEAQERRIAPEHAAEEAYNTCFVFSLRNLAAQYGGAAAHPATVIAAYVRTEWARDPAPVRAAAARACARARRNAPR
jgi:hypothetical protein